MRNTRLDVYARIVKFSNSLIVERTHSNWIYLKIFIFIRKRIGNDEKIGIDKSYLIFVLRLDYRMILGIILIFNSIILLYLLHNIIQTNFNISAYFI